MPRGQDAKVQGPEAHREKASIGGDSHPLFRRNLTFDTHPPTCSAFPKLPTPPAKDARTANKISKLVVFFLFQRCRLSVVAMETPASFSEVRPQLPPVALAASPQPWTLFLQPAVPPPAMFALAGPQPQPPVPPGQAGSDAMGGGRDGSGWGGEDFRRTRHTSG